MGIIQSIIDTSLDGIIIVNSDEKTLYINESAKHYFGLKHISGAVHPAGKIEPGDLIIIADTAMGGDDGNLTAEDLENIGIYNNKISPMDMLLAIGTFKDNSFKPVYKTLPQNDINTLNLSTTWNNIPIMARIEHGKTIISVGDVSYAIEFFLYIGQIVIVDSKTHKVKFWQEKGYSAKKEGIGDLLRGDHAFSAKNDNLEIDISGKNFKEFLHGKEFGEDIAKVINYPNYEIENKQYSINGYMLVASIIHFHDEEEQTGAIIKFRKIEDIKTTISERNRAIQNIEQAYQQANKILTPNYEKIPLSSFGRSSGMAYSKRKAYKLSQLDCNILLTGESGTGKSFLAKNIVKVQPRKGPFIVADCTTIVPTLFESEMFGYVGGAFTGADPKGKKGFFEEANGGTIFLDEIGELPNNIQSKILNVIQNKVIYRVGSPKAIPVDVRIIAATNRNLQEEIKEKKFRKDLYYRLSAFSIELLPLRACTEDIYLIIDALMDRLKKKYNKPGVLLSGEAFSKLISYDWPGNIRELENILESAVALTDTDIIYAEQIDLDVSSVNTTTLKGYLREEERRIIKRALIQNDGDIKKVMDILDLSQSTLYRKMKEYAINISTK